MLVVGLVAVRSRANTILIGLIVAFIMITLFNVQSPFKASYFSSFAVEVFVVWTIYIAFVRAIFGRRRRTTDSALHVEPNEEIAEDGP